MPSFFFFFFRVAYPFAIILSPAHSIRDERPHNTNNGLAAEKVEKVGKNERGGIDGSCVSASAEETSMKDASRLLVALVDFVISPLRLSGERKQHKPNPITTPKERERRKKIITDELGIFLQSIYRNYHYGFCCFIMRRFVFQCAELSNDRTITRVLTSSVRGPLFPTSLVKFERV